MKISVLFTLLLVAFLGNSQSLPIDFESAVETGDFENFDGGIATVIPNPQSNGINTSSTVAKIVRSGGAIYAGSKILLDANLDFSTNTALSMKVFTTAPIGTIVKFKLEGGEIAERDIPTTLTGEWETLTWEFAGTTATNNYVVFMFDFGNVGNGLETSTFLFDDVVQGPGEVQEEPGDQLDLPVTFEDSAVEYSVIDFEGNASMIVVDPTDPSNTVVMSTKTITAAPWAGTTIGTNAGFITDIPLTLTDSQMSARVWSPTAGTPIRLKVEDANDVTHTCETETNTTLAGEWETIVFDFTNEGPGTALLSVGLDNGWIYNKASIFFNYGTDGATVGEEISYYFDDVYFGVPASGIEGVNEITFNVFPNPTSDIWTISNENSEISSVEVYDLNGKLVCSQTPNSNIISINALNLNEGVYVSRLITPSGTKFVKLVKN
jgi:hypothetical protein